MWWFVAIFVVALVIAFAMMPKPQSNDVAAKGLADVTAPTAEDGLEIAVLFGTRVLEAPNCVWYGDIRSQAIQR